MHGSMDRFLPLAALAVMVARDHRCCPVTAYDIELVAEMCHLIGTVFISGDNLIDRIDNDREVVFLGRPANKLCASLSWARSFLSDSKYRYY